MTATKLGCKAENWRSTLLTLLHVLQNRPLEQVNSPAVQPSGYQNNRDWFLYNSLIIFQFSLILEMFLNYLLICAYWSIVFTKLKLVKNLLPQSLFWLSSGWSRKNSLCKMPFTKLIIFLGTFIEALFINKLKWLSSSSTSKNEFPNASLF